LPLLSAQDDAAVEDQYVDRKEACRPQPDGTVRDKDVRELRAQVVECVSAFANTNQLGGLVCLGISRTGQILGVDHLSDPQRLCLTSFNIQLRNHAAQPKLVDCTLSSGAPGKLILIYVPFTPDEICETVESRAKSWRRSGPQNLPLDDRQRDQLRRDKRIVDYENGLVCPFTPADLDQGIWKEVRATWPLVSETTLSDEDLLHQIGAIERGTSGWEFTRAGFLFFASNPQRIFAHAYTRLLRFEAKLADANRGLPTFEKKFSGPLTKQIRDFRTFTKESGFFKVYQYRKPDGGFAEEPEYPPTAVDEAVLNAIAHRDYACSWPVECEAYNDVLVVRNAGRLIQRNSNVPEHFSLEDTKLIHTPRNPKLIEWLKAMRDPQGAAFVRALSEGTRQMRDEMAKLKLPPPVYDITEAETKVTLFGEQERRSAHVAQMEEVSPVEFTNLFPLDFLRPGRSKPEYSIPHENRRDLLTCLRDSLIAKGWFADQLAHGLLTAHRRGVKAPVPAEAAKVVGLYPAYCFGIRDYADRSYLLLDFTLEVKNLLTVQDLLDHLGTDEIVGRTAIAKCNGWQRGRISEVTDEIVRVRLFDYEQEHVVSRAEVIPDLSTRLIRRILSAKGIRFDMDSAIKQHSLASQPAAARIRSEKTIRLAGELAQEVFPIVFHGTTIGLVSKPLPLVRDPRVSSGLQTRALEEPHVEFGHHRETANIREGITEFGAYQSDARDIEIVPVVFQAHRPQMAALIERLKVGKYKYRGSERTFSTRFTYAGIVTSDSIQAIPSECQRLLTEHPTWKADKTLSRIFLIHAPEHGYASDDEKSPYFQSKRLLLESGIPCQMVDTPTLANPDYKDLNLALNIVAKCGITPWVLPDGIPDADFFVGLSYTENRQAGSPRLMGYANVFNEYGKWLFYSGNMQPFPYEERGARFRELVKSTLIRLNPSETPNIYFHYSARFSRDDREAILSAAREVRPQGVYSFVWINTHHRVRLYDSRPETDGSLSRGSYVIGGPAQVFVSTTGYNPYRKAMGTPQMLEVNAWQSYPPGQPKGPIDLKALAVQILALTKLNWSSTDSLCGEPITTKYAGDIAYLTAAFLRQKEGFTLHPVLEPTPWFI